MKKTVSLLALLTIALSSNLYGQSKELQQHKNSVDRIKSQSNLEKKNSKVRFGLKAGVNLSNIQDNASGFDYNSKVGIVVGGLVQIPISKKLFIQPELLYSMQGSNADIPEEETKLKMKMDYLNIPIMVKYNVFDRFFVEAGPQIGFLLSSKIIADYADDAIFDDGLTLDDKEFKNNIDLSIGIGASYDWTANISTGIRYNIGVSNVYKKGMEILDDDGTYGTSKNGVFQFSVGYKF